MWGERERGEEEGGIAFEISPRGPEPTNNTIIEVLKFKSKQFTFEIGPKGSRSTKKVVPTGKGGRGGRGRGREGER